MLYFCSLGRELYSILTSSIWPNSSILSPFVIFDHLKGSRGEPLTSDSNQNLYMGLIDKPYILRWNTSLPFESDNLEAFIDIDRKDLSWINSMWIRDGFLWLTHNKYLNLRY